MAELQTAPSAREQSSDLLEAARAGDRSACEQLVLSCEQLAFRLAYLAVRDPAVAAELATRSFMAAFFGLDRTDDSLAFTSNLLRHIVERVPAPRKSPRMRARDAAAQRSRQLPPEIAAVRGERIRLALAGVTRLPAEDQTVLYLRYFLACDDGKVAAILGCSARQARVRAERALRRARDEIERRPRFARGPAAGMPDMEQDLRATAACFPYPPTAAIAEEVRQRLESPQAPESQAAQAESPRRWPLLRLWRRLTPRLPLQ